MVASSSAAVTVIKLFVVHLPLNHGKLVQL